MERPHPERFVVACLALAGCHKHEPEPAPAPPAPPHAVAATREPIHIDGELSEPSWNELGDPQTFRRDGQEARPYSQIRFLHDADHLYVGLYAADQEILSTDKFELHIGTLALAVDPLARVTPTLAGVTAAKDVDGTIDQAGDEDEEWVIELAIPLAATGLRVGGDPVTVTASRCDTPKDGVPRCGSWTGAVRLTP